VLHRRRIIMHIRETSRFRHRRARLLRKPVPGSVRLARSQAQPDMARRKRASWSYRLVIISIGRSCRPSTAHDGKGHTHGSTWPCSLFSPSMNEKNDKTCPVAFRLGRSRMTSSSTCWPRGRVTEPQTSIQSGGFIPRAWRSYACSLEEPRVGPVLHLSRARIWRTACDGSLSSPF
jgi:hypothetical protein